MQGKTVKKMIPKWVTIKTHQKQQETQDVGSLQLKKTTTNTSPIIKTPTKSFLNLTQVP